MGKDSCVWKPNVEVCSCKAIFSSSLLSYFFSGKTNNNVIQRRGLKIIKFNTKWSSGLWLNIHLLCSVDFFFSDFFLSEFHFVQTYSYILKFTIFFYFAVSNVLLISSKKHTKYCIVLLQKLHLVLFYSWIIIVMVSIISLSKFIMNRA